MVTGPSLKPTGSVLTKGQSGFSATSSAVNSGLLVLIIVAGAIFRFHALTKRNFWDDEAASVIFAQLHWRCVHFCDLPARQAAVRPQGGTRQCRVISGKHVSDSIFAGGARLQLVVFALYSVNLLPSARDRV